MVNRKQHLNKKYYLAYLSLLFGILIRELVFVPVLAGFGLSIFSTPKGIMADVDARKENLGGEFLFNIW